MSSSCDVIQDIVDRVVEWNLRDCSVYGFTPMHVAACGRDEETIESLVREGFDPNDCGKCNVAPLHLAAMTGNAGIVKKLIERGANVHCRDKIYKCTPLHLAAMRGKFAIIREMTGLAAEDTDDDSSSMVAHGLNYSRFPRHYETTTITLLEAGAAVNAKDNRRRTPLHYATRLRDDNFVSLAEVLLKTGANVNVNDSNGYSPLHNSLLSDDENNVKCLLTYGADINDVLRVFKATSPFFVEHLIKLKIIDVLVNDALRGYLKRRISYRWNNLNSINSSADIAYWKEMRKLKRVMLVPDVSLFSWLHMDWKRRLTLIDNLPSNLENEFPHYSDVIQNFRYEAVNRSIFVESAKLAYRTITGLYWPDLCVDCVFSFLNERDLDALIDAAAESEY